jgi:hypothetical protein
MDALGPPHHRWMLADGNLALSMELADDTSSMESALRHSAASPFMSLGVAIIELFNPSALVGLV